MFEMFERFDNSPDATTSGVVRLYQFYYHSTADTASMHTQDL